MSDSAFVRKVEKIIDSTADENDFCQSVDSLFREHNSKEALLIHSSSTGNTLLHRAAGLGYMAAEKLLLQINAMDVRDKHTVLTATNESGEMALASAAQTGNLTVITKLLKVAARLWKQNEMLACVASSMDNQGYTPADQLQGSGCVKKSPLFQKVLEELAKTAKWEQTVIKHLGAQVATVGRTSHDVMIEIPPHSMDRVPPSSGTFSANFKPDGRDIKTLKSLGLSSGETDKSADSSASSGPPSRRQ